MLKLPLALAAALVAGPAAAHDVWSNGAQVPEWVQDACCSTSDAHRLSPEQVQLKPTGYRIDGIRDIVPFAKTLPSQDGDYWIFYRNYADGTQYVFCLFAPATGF